MPERELAFNALANISCDVASTIIVCERKNNILVLFNSQNV
jgi:hypothetical protein